MNEVGGKENQKDLLCYLQLVCTVDYLDHYRISNL